jgi:hypothetical protein
MAFTGGYEAKICVKTDIKVPGHNQVLPYKHTRANVTGRNENVSFNTTWKSPDMEDAQQAGATR